MNRIKLIKRLLAQNVSKGKFIKWSKKLRVVGQPVCAIPQTVPAISMHINYLSGCL